MNEYTVIFSKRSDDEYFVHLLCGRTGVYQRLIGWATEHEARDTAFAAVRALDMAGHDVVRRWVKE